MNIITREKEEKIIESYLSDLKKTMTEVSKELNVERKTVARTLKRNNIEIRRPYKLTENDKENIKILYLSGYTTQQLGKIYSVHHGRIGDFLRENNILRTAGQTQKLTGVNRKKKGRTRPIDIEKIKKLYNDGWTLKEISEIENYSIPQLSFIFKEQNFKLRCSLTNKTQKHRERIAATIAGMDYSEYILKLPKYIKYRRTVVRLTTKEKFKDLPNYDKRGVTGIPGAYHLDHKYSILHGFTNNVPPEIISNIVNLEFIPWEENILKKSGCSISLDELYQKYNEYINNKLND